MRRTYGCRTRTAPVFEVELVADGDAQCADGGAVADDRVGVEWAGHYAVAEEFGVAT